MDENQVDKYKERNKRKQLKKPKSQKDWSGINDPKPPATRPNYAKYLKMQKEELRVDKEKDGKQELDYGKEELDKDTDMGQAANSNYIAQQEYERDLKDRWKKLKKAMADDAFMDIEEATATPEPEEEEVPQEGEEQGPPEGDLEQDSMGGEDLSDDELHDMLSGMEGGDEEEDSDQEQNPEDDSEEEEISPDEEGEPDGDGR